MEEKIKEIVSGFIKIPAEQIGAGTPIGRGALQSSILLHRMYARLGEAGVVIDDYGAINVFGDLLSRQGSTAENGHRTDSGPIQLMSYGVSDASEGGVGIDIEAVEALPKVSDFRTAAFYTQNFTQREIAYCILQPDPYASLTGLFAAKEAIVKSDAQFRNRPFHTIEISHSAEGRPTHPGFRLSISHAGGMAAAIAVGLAEFRGEAAQATGTSSSAAAPSSNTPKPSAVGAWIGWIALLLAAAALVIALKR